MAATKLSSGTDYKEIRTGDGTITMKIKPRITRGLRLHLTKCNLVPPTVLLQTQLTFFRE